MFSYEDALDAIKDAEDYAAMKDSILAQGPNMELMGMIELSYEEAMAGIQAGADEAHGFVDGMIAMTAAVYGRREYQVRSDVKNHVRRPWALSVPAAARALGCSQDNVRQMLRRGTLGGEKRGGRWVVWDDDVEIMIQDRDQGIAKR